MYVRLCVSEWRALGEIFKSNGSRDNHQKKWKMFCRTRNQNRICIGGGGGGVGGL